MKKEVQNKINSIFNTNITNYDVSDAASIAYTYYITNGINKKK